MVEDNTDLAALEKDLSDQEREKVERIEKSLVGKIAASNPEEKARKAALLSMKRERASIASGHQLLEGVENPEESDSEAIAVALEKDVEASREYREYLEQIGVFPIEPNEQE